MQHTFPKKELEKLKLEDNPMYILFSHHIEDDNKESENNKKSFEEINKKLDRREEIAIINGTHLSDIGKSLAEINKTVQDVILPHITAVSPILKEYQEKQENERAFMRLGANIKKYGFWVTFIASVLLGLVAIVNFLKFK